MPDRPVRLTPDARWSELASRLDRRGHLVGHAATGDWGTGRRGSRRLIRTALAELLGLTVERIGLARDRLRRPYAVDRSTGAPLPLDLNLSHTEHVLVLGVSRHGRIGVDVERSDREIATTPGMLRRVCHPGERAALATVPTAERVEQISRMWTCKEAVLKADGRGLALDPAAVRVIDPQPDWAVHAHRVDDPERPDAAPLWVATALLDRVLPPSAAVPAGRHPVPPADPPAGYPAGRALGAGPVRLPVPAPHRAIGIPDRPRPTVQEAVR